MSENYPMEGTDCPQCGDTLLAGTVMVRENSRTGHLFYGCTSWPHCNWTINPSDAENACMFFSRFGMYDEVDPHGGD